MNKIVHIFSRIPGKTLSTSWFEHVAEVYIAILANVAYTLYFEIQPFINQSTSESISNLNYSGKVDVTDKQVPDGYMCLLPLEFHKSVMP